MAEVVGHRAAAKLRRMSGYTKQHRGDATAYASYFAGMDASMQQKVAYTTAHFPTRGRIADMGSGSGLGTWQLATLHPQLHLVGVDINPVSVELAQQTYRLPNLEYREGDIGRPLFEGGSLDGILNSSVLHHVTSFNAFDADRVRSALEAQARQLKVGGVVVIRDFVIGRGPPMVLLDLPTTDGADDGEVPQLSTTALFHRFAHGFRSSVNPDWPVPFAQVPGAPAGFARFKLPRRAAAEFLLRKDYRRDWETELLEEYTYFSQADFEAEFRRLGLRILVSQEVHNPWIVSHRFLGKVMIRDLRGEPLPFPPTNYVIVGERVGPRRGVLLREAIRRREQPPRFLSLQHFQHRQTGQQFELVRRPHPTVDLVPWFERNGRILVVARQGFPRPIVNARHEADELSRINVGGYVSEPITAVAEARGSEDLVRDLLARRSGLGADRIRAVGPELLFFPSPGGVNELVCARLVELRDGFESQETPNTTAFCSAGQLRELDAQQLLRASQVGGMYDARLELLVYLLLRQRGVALEPWIGAAPRLEVQPGTRPPVPLSQLLGRAGGAGWEVLPDAPPTFLEIREGTFAEEDEHGEAVRTARFEYVVPRALSANTVTVLPILLTDQGIQVGLELRDLPAVGQHFETAELVTSPAWRLPQHLQSLDAAQQWVQQRLRQDFQVSVRHTWQLGGRYFPSAGVTPEVVYPLLCEVDAATAAGSSLRWVDLEELLDQARLLHDGHLLTVLFRAAHALGK